MRRPTAMLAATAACVLAGVVRAEAEAGPMMMMDKDMMMMDKPAVAEEKMDMMEMMEKPMMAARLHKEHPLPENHHQMTHHGHGSFTHRSQYGYTSFHFPSASHSFHHPEPVYPAAPKPHPTPAYAHPTPAPYVAPVVHHHPTPAPYVAPAHPVAPVHHVAPAHHAVHHAPTAPAYPVHPTPAYAHPHHPAPAYPHPHHPAPAYAHPTPTPYHHPEPAHPTPTPYHHPEPAYPAHHVAPSYPAHPAPHHPGYVHPVHHQPARPAYVAHPHKAHAMHPHVTYAPAAPAHHPHAPHHHASPYHQPHHMAYHPHQPVAPAESPMKEAAPMTDVAPAAPAPKGTPKYLGKFKNAKNDVDGDIFLLDESTIYIQGFSFDGQAPDVYFFSDGVKIPYYTRSDPHMKLNVKEYRNEDVVLMLPPEKPTIKELGHFQVWCNMFNVVFGEFSMDDSM